MIKNGFFAKKLLLDTVNNILLNTEESRIYGQEANCFFKKNTHRKEESICTNSDQIEHCEELLKTFTEMHFHIAAFTMMLPTLMDMGVYKDVNLYPCIGIKYLESLFEVCDYYFDINHWSESDSAVYEYFKKL